MTTEEDARRTLLIEAQIELYRGRARWELWNAIAMLIVAATVFCVGVLGVVLLRHPSPQSINVRIEKLPQ
jgi:hypothetical protein